MKQGVIILPRVFYLIVMVSFFSVLIPGKTSFAHQLEYNWDYLTPYHADRGIDTVSLHAVEKISESNTRSVYRGITITHPHGDVLLENRKQPESCSAVGIGPVYMIRDEIYNSGKLTTAVDTSGGFIVYDKAFPADGRSYNFMWRIGPQFIYKVNKDSSINAGYTFMHVSNGFRTRNPGYEAHGISLGFKTSF